MAKASGRFSMHRPLFRLTAAVLAVLGVGSSSCGGKALVDDSTGTASVTGGAPSFGSGGAFSASGGNPGNGKPMFPGNGATPGTTGPATMPTIDPGIIQPPVIVSCPTSPKDLAYFLTAALWGNTAFIAEVLPIVDALPTTDVIKLMQADPRSQVGLEKFALDWFGLTNVSIDFGGATGTGGASNSPQHTPDQLMAEEGRLFVQWTLQDRQGTLEQIFTSSQSVINRELADYYAAPPPPSPPGSDLWNTVDLGAQERFGILTRGFWLARNVNAARRGKAVLEDALCSLVPAPPANVAPHGATPPPHLSAVEIRAQVNDPVCQGCHTLIDPAGGAFEHFNGVGQYRPVLSGGQPIDASGYFASSFDQGESTFKFQSVREFMAQLATSPNLEQCLVKKVAAYTQREALGGQPFESSPLNCALKSNPGLGARSIADAMRVLLSNLTSISRLGIK